ncbi:putative Rho GTPase activation protein [Helianthus anomalus]
MLHFNFTRQSSSKNTKVYHVFVPGKTEFGSDEDAPDVGDCVKHVLRELPSSHVPASCCTALLEAHSVFISLLILVVTFGIRILILLIKQGIDRKEARVNAMRAEILETFPEPNRRLLQSCCNKYIKLEKFICRILKMMHYFFTFI